MADRQWLVENVQLFEEGEDEYHVENVQVNEGLTAGVTFGGPTTYHLGADVTPRTVLTLRPA